MFRVSKTLRLLRILIKKKTKNENPESAVGPARANSTQLVIRLVSISLNCIAFAVPTRLSSFLRTKSAPPFSADKFRSLKKNANRQLELRSSCFAVNLLNAVSLDEGTR